MIIKKTLDLNNIKQIVDINGEMINFTADFQIISKNNVPFQLCIMDQTSLDNGDKIEYKNVNGSISGNVKNDKNIYQNFFLLLKTDQKNCSCDITIDLNETQPQTETSSPPQIPDKLQEDKSSPSDSSCNIWKILKIVAIVAIIGVGIYYGYKYYIKKEPNTVTTKQNNIPPPSPANQDKDFNFSDNFSSVGLSPSVKSPIKPSFNNKSFLSRLKKLNLNNN
jgi:hypothetical protein